MIPLFHNPRRPYKWMLFAAFLLTVPVPYYMIVVAGLVPTVWILYFAVQWVFVAVPKLTAEGFWMLGIIWAHIVILGGLLYVAATGMTWILFRLLGAWFGRLAVVLLIIALFVASTFEIYRLPGHNSAPPANIFQIIKSLAT
ncbi:MAG: hypothetical protein U1B94_07250 [candidate division NC10 bacterium]|nr:hypothetical protein [candidate division NC10 bacterium]